MLAPSRGGSDGTVRLDGVTVTKNPTLHEGDYTSFTLNVSGSNFGEKLGTDSHKSYSLSFNTSSANFENVFSKDPQVQKSGLDTVPVYLYKSFKYGISNLRSNLNYVNFLSTTESVQR